MPYWLNGDRRWPHCEIELIEFEGVWSFSFHLRVELYHHRFPSMPQYRKTCTSSKAAFEAARLIIRKDIENNWKIRQHKGPGPIARKVTRWIDQLHYEHQMGLSLFK
ncbi:MAG: hypothetical protein OXJ55_07985 [Caldilineaceae bacterium]|nr:hypothetical protein [Caldilineaceae bacterium]